MRCRPGEITPKGSVRRFVARGEVIGWDGPAASWLLPLDAPALARSRDAMHRLKGLPRRERAQVEQAVGLVT